MYRDGSMMRPDSKNISLLFNSKLILCNCDLQWLNKTKLSITNVLNIFFFFLFKSGMMASPGLNLGTLLHMYNSYSEISSFFYYYFIGQKTPTSTPLTQSLTTTESRSVSSGSILPTSTVTTSSGSEMERCIAHHSRKDSELSTSI